MGCPCSLVPPPRRLHSTGSIKVASSNPQTCTLWCFKVTPPESQAVLRTRNVYRGPLASPSGSVPFPFGGNEFVSVRQDPHFVACLRKVLRRPLKVESDSGSTEDRRFGVPSQRAARGVPGPVETSRVRCATTNGFASTAYPEQGEQKHPIVP